MRRRLGAGLAGAVAVTGAAFVPGPSPAGDPHRARAPRPAGAPPVVSPALRDADASAAPGALLERAAAAVDAVAYSGVRLVRGPTRAAFVDLVHVPGHATLLRVRPAAPPARAVGAAPFQRYPDREATGKPHAAVALLERAYDASLAGTGTILGREADLVELRRHGRLAARLWLDRRTGLTLRRDVFDANSAVVRSSGFVALAVVDAVPRGPAADRELARGPETPQSLLALPARPPPAPTRTPPTGTPPTARWSNPLDRRAIERLRATGWPVPATLPPGLVLATVRRGLGTDPPELHLHYTDGLATVSVFTTRGRLSRRLPGSWRVRDVSGRRVHVPAGEGGPRQPLVWEGPGVVYTMMADAPAEVVAAAVAALPPAAGEDPLRRLGRGLARLGSWLDPLG